MRNGETGEFELVVGNRQVLSAFFIVVLLFALAFSMGYIVGRNSSPSAKLQAEAAAGGNPVLEQRPQPAAPAPAPPVPRQQAAAETEPPAGGRALPQPTTQPAPDARTPPAPPVSTPAEAPPGSYWQVWAGKSSAEAEALLRTLRDKGFNASFVSGPDNLSHLLVGPYSDTQAMGRARTELETNFGLHPIRK